jgi:hypothetical protein
VEQTQNIRIKIENETENYFEIFFEVVVVITFKPGVAIIDCLKNLGPLSY